MSQNVQMPASSDSAAGDPDELVTIHITQKPWECRAQEGAPFLFHGFNKAISNQENPLHWCYKIFRAYKREGPGRVKVSISGQNVVFYAAKSVPDGQKGLVLFYACVKDNKWWIFAPGKDDIEKKNKDDLWGYKCAFEFWVSVPQWQCAKCTLTNSTNQEECEACHETRQEVQEQEHKRGPGVVPFDTDSSFDMDLPAKTENEVSVCVSNKQWECRLSMNTPHEGGNWERGLADGNPHHWAYKQFRAFKNPAPGLIEVSVHNHAKFYAYAKQEKPNLTLYYFCWKSNTSYWVFPPNDEDIQRKEQNQLWGTQVAYEFWALSEVPTRLPKSDKKEKIDIDSYLENQNLRRVKIQDTPINCIFRSCADQESILTGKSQETIANEMRNHVSASVTSKWDELKSSFSGIDPSQVKSAILNPKAEDLDPKIGDGLVLALAKLYRRHLHIHRGGKKEVPCDSGEGIWQLVIVGSRFDSTRPLRNLNFPKESIASLATSAAIMTSLSGSTISSK